MSGEEYIRQVLAHYAVSAGPSSPAMQAANKIASTLTSWAGEHLVELLASGSYAKGTAIAGNTDIDIFISLKSSAPKLKDVYESLATRAQQEGWNSRQQNVSVGIHVDGVRIDLVPGKQQEGYQNYHSLWKRRQNTWTQTNVLLHIERVRDSGRIDVIRAIKIWRKNHKLDFPSFYLELTVLDALSGYGSDLERNVQTVLAYIRDKLVAAKVMDPANTNNCISDDLTTVDKQIVAMQAGLSYSENLWSKTLW